MSTLGIFLIHGDKIQVHNSRGAESQKTVTTWELVEVEAFSYLRKQKWPCKQQQQQQQQTNPKHSQQTQQDSKEALEEERLF